MNETLLRAPFKISVLLMILYYIFMILASIIARAIFQQFPYYLFAVLNFFFIFSFLAILWLIIVPIGFKLPYGQESLREYLEIICLDKSTFTPLKSIILISLAWSGLMIFIGIIIIIFPRNNLNIIKNLFSIPSAENSAWLIFLFPIIPAIWEEIAFRGVILSMFKRKYKEDNNSLICAINGFLFGIFHFGNILFGANLIRTLIQVIFASLMGVYLSFLTLNTKKLFSAILTHYLLDVLFFLASNNL